MDSGAMCAEIAYLCSTVAPEFRHIARVARNRSLPKPFVRQVGEAFLGSKLLFNAATWGPLSGKLWQRVKGQHAKIYRACLGLALANHPDEHVTSGH
eukprot:5830046-Pyramimonas_sp.AAC.1